MASNLSRWCYNQRLSSLRHEVYDRYQISPVPRLDIGFLFHSQDLCYVLLSCARPLLTSDHITDNKLGSTIIVFAKDTNSHSATTVSRSGTSHKKRQNLHQPSYHYRVLERSYPPRLDPPLAHILPQSPARLVSKRFSHHPT